MELDKSDSDSVFHGDKDDPKRKTNDRKQKFEFERETMDCFQSLSIDLKSVDVVLEQLLKLPGDPCLSKNLALVGMCDEIAKSASTI